MCMYVYKVQPLYLNYPFVMSLKNIHIVQVRDRHMIMYNKNQSVPYSLHMCRVKQMMIYEENFGKTYHIFNRYYS
jgi:hypothetical protein